jgi:DNA-binding MurR/RpiR family transcriptional regulator
MTAIPIPERGTVAERIRVLRNHLAPAELAVANVLVESYPMAGLVPVIELAEAARVSAPTVLRFVGKLGFKGYGAFHKALKAEVQARIFSPVDAYPGTPGGDGMEASLAHAQTAFLENIRSTFAHLDPRELASSVAALADVNRPVTVLGGRYSSVLATQLGGYLSMLRRGVSVVAPSSGARIAGMVDMGPETVAVVFDYRRYQQASIDWGMEAAARGVYLIVITDQYLSPLAPHANALLTTNTSALHPFDSMTGGFALTELLISEVARSLGKPARRRLSAFEQLQLEEEQKRRKIPTKRG